MLATEHPLLSHETTESAWVPGAGRQLAVEVTHLSIDMNHLRMVMAEVATVVVKQEHERLLTRLRELDPAHAAALAAILASEDTIDRLKGTPP